MSLFDELPYSEPIDTAGKPDRSRFYRTAQSKTRPLTEDDYNRVSPKPGAPRTLADIPEQFRKPTAPPGRKV